MSKIQVLIQSEIESLLAKPKGYQTIEHNTTKGNLRETLLIEFFKKLIPPSLSISSGFICDCYGKISNQTDFIVYDKSILPSIFLDKNISMILDRKSTRLNSSHVAISYAVFCLKTKKQLN